MHVLFLHLFTQAKNYIRGLPKVPKKDLNTIFFKASSEGKPFLTFAILLKLYRQCCIIKNVLCLGSAVGALERMLVLDPEKRVSATEALELSLFTEFREPEEETEAMPYDHSMDNMELPLDQWKRTLAINAFYIFIFHKGALKRLI